MLDPRTRRRQRRRNAAQTVLLLGSMVGVPTGVVALLFGASGVPWMLAVGAVVLLVRPKVPVRWALSVHGARPLPASAAPQLHRYVEVLSREAGLPRPPELWYVPSRLTNAFSLGTPHGSAIAVSDGLLRRLTQRQVVGVLAHEISHVRAGDTSIMTLSDAIGRLVQGLSYVGVFLVVLSLPMVVTGDLRPLTTAAVLVVLPTGITLLQLALSRSREYDADLEGVSLTGDPEGLASALATLENADGRLWERILVGQGRVPDPLLLRTHPPTAERVRRLLALTGGRSRVVLPEDRAVPPHSYPPITVPPRWRAPGIRW